MKLTLLFGLLLLAASCHVLSNDFACEKAEALEFRRLAGEKNFRQIYQNASDAFKKATDENAFVAGLGSIADEISKPNYFELIRTSTNVNLETTPLTLLAFGHTGEGVVAFDEFVFIEQDGKCRLFNYRTEGRDEQPPDEIDKSSVPQ